MVQIMSSLEITLDQFRAAVPKKLRKNISEDLYDVINDITQDDVFREHYRENLLSFTGVLQNGAKFRISEYVNAVKFVSNKLIGSTDMVSYIATFPDRYQKMVDAGYTTNNISGHVSAYNKTQLVNKILEQSMVPTYVLNQDLHQKALNVQAQLMMSANSEKVRSDAANSLLTHLKVPEAQKLELDINIKEDDSINQLRQSTLDLVAAQKQMLAAGMSNAKDIAESKIINTIDYEEVS